MENELVKVFNYNGCPISFKTENGTMVNATEMAKPFGKSTADWMRLKSTDDFIRELSSVKGIPISQLTVVLKGKSSQFTQGTWMHKDVAIEFAHWLSPKFAIWCNDRILELMQFGVTASPQMIENMLNDPDVAIRAFEEIKRIRKEKEALEKENSKQLKEIKRMAPKEEYVDKCLQSDAYFTATQIAKDLGFNTVPFNKKLKEIGFQYKQGSQWLLKDPYHKWGISKDCTEVIDLCNNKTRTVHITKFNERGFLFFRKLVEFGWDIKKAAYECGFITGVRIKE